MEYVEKKEKIDDKVWETLLLWKDYLILIGNNIKKNKF